MPHGIIKTTKTPKSHQRKKLEHTLFGRFYKSQQCHPEFLSLHCFLEDMAWFLLHFLRVWAYLPLQKGFTLVVRLSFLG